MSCSPPTAPSPPHRRSSDPVAGITAMLDEEAAMPLPGKGILIGKAAVDRGVQGQPRLPGRPRQLGAGARRHFRRRHAGLHLRLPHRRLRRSPPGASRKYLSYWVKRPAGWRVVAYRQNPARGGRRFDGDDRAGASGLQRQAEGRRRAASPPTRPASPPPRKAFSDRAQIVGLKKAFGEYGRPDAMNMYAGAGFAVGLDAVIAGFKEEGPAKIHWSTERSFVASSGDLGVSIGMIRPNDAAQGRRARRLPLLHRLEARHARPALALYRRISVNRLRPARCEKPAPAGARARG